MRGWPRLNSEKRLGGGWPCLNSETVFGCPILAGLSYARVGSFSCPISIFQFLFSTDLGVGQPSEWRAASGFTKEAVFDFIFSLLDTHAQRTEFLPTGHSWFSTNDLQLKT